MDDHKEIIRTWISKKPSLKSIEGDICDIFKVAINNTMLPEKSWFGFPTSRNSLNIIFGNVYLIGIFGDTIEIIVDADLENETGFKTRVVKSSISSGNLLYWITSDLKDIKALTNNEIIWEHYKMASIKVLNSITIKTVRKDWTVGKVLLSDLDQNKTAKLDLKIYENIFDREVKVSMKDSRTNRIKRLNLANKKPIITNTIVKTFIRNPDVVAEVLYRANEVCEYCNTKAPFKKDSDGKGFLEVHHIIPLAEKGEDTVKNAVGLCPNCHRKAHFGKKDFDIEILKKICQAESDFELTEEMKAILDERLLEDGSDYISAEESIIQLKSKPTRTQAI
jgi:hypothetical protein